jgi:hypothetical protein
MPTYGSYTDPTELGSGGGSTSVGGAGGNGGGLIRIQAGTVTLNGNILANGGNATFSGSGGAIKLQVGALNMSASAQIQANGGNSNGGGGRVAIYYTQNTGVALTASNVMARGISGAGTGTVFLKADAQSFGDLRCDNAGLSPPPASNPFSPLPPTGTGTITFDNLFVTGGAKLSTPDSLTVLGTFTVDSISRLQAANLTRP